MTEVYRMGVDIGTTSTKAVLFNRENQVVEQIGLEYPLHTPEAGAAEQDPDEIVRAVQTAIHSVMKTSQIKRESLQFIAFSAAMHSLIAVDKEGKPLIPSITWADQRSEAFAEQLKENNGQQVYERTGTPIHPMSPLPKLMWLKEERTDLFSESGKVYWNKRICF
jgi:gluconokinase